MNKTEHTTVRNIEDSTLSVDARRARLVDRRFAPLLILFLAAACGKKTETTASNGQVDPRACASCHPGVARAFARTGMGRSFAPASAELMPPGGAITARDGKFYFRDESASGGTAEKQVHYVLGSGHLAKAFLHRTADNNLITLPLTWYAAAGFTAGPGFAHAGHPGDSPAVSTACLACHDAYPAGFAERRAEDPVFPASLPAGIDCQRCHGPGAEHVAQGGRGPIVNPKRLSARRQAEVCLQCHLQTTSSPLPGALQNFGTAAFSYVPGKALGDYYTYFDHAPGRGHDSKFELGGAAYRLRQSACFQRSGDRLQCTSCHDPHGERQVAVTPVCQSCHPTLGATHAAVAQQTCESCHMPKRPAEDAPRAAVTDHRIARPLATAPKPAATPAKGYRGEVIPYYPPEADEGMVATAQVIGQSNLAAGIARLQAYRLRTAEHELALADALRAAGRLPEALPHYEKAAQDSGFIAARIQFGSALRQSGDAVRARQVLESALAAAPDRPAGWYELGLAHAAARDPQAARNAFDKALALDPGFTPARNARAKVSP